MGIHSSHTRTCEWTGLSGQTYTYEIYPIGTIFNPVAGNYIFAVEAGPRRWRAVYIGETGDLSERFDDHHKMPCIVRNGATHIHVKATPGGRAQRVAEERDLVARYRPPCNG